MPFPPEHTEKPVGPPNTGHLGEGGSLELGLRRTMWGVSAVRGVSGRLTTKAGQAREGAGPGARRTEVLARPQESTDIRAGRRSHEHMEKEQSWGAGGDTKRVSECRGPGVSTFCVFSFTVKALIQQISAHSVAETYAMLPDGYGIWTALKSIACPRVPVLLLPRPNAPTVVHVMCVSATVF